MKRSWIRSTVTVLALAVGAFAGFPVTASASPRVTAQVVTTFAPGDGGAFAESMAVDNHGRLIVSVTNWGVEQGGGSWTDNVGQLYLVTADGTKTPYGPRLDLGGCSQLMGVTVDAGRVFVAVGNFDASCGPSSPPSGVFRVAESSATPVLTLPAGAFANGVVIAHGMFYVTDSFGGSVWSGPVDHASSPVRPWFNSTKLAPTAAISLGANGLAYRDGALYVTGYASGYVLSVRIDRAGRATDARVVAHDSRLVRADGIAFDARGTLWVAVNPLVDFATMTQTGSGALVVIDGGHVRTVATPIGSLDYPTQAVPFGDGVAVVNGSYVNGTPSVVKLTHLG